MRNVGNVDRIVRLVAAVALVIAGVAASGWLAGVFFVLAAVMALTAALGTCPIYRLVGLNACGTGGRGARA